MGRARGSGSSSNGSLSLRAAAPSGVASTARLATAAGSTPDLPRQWLSGVSLLRSLVDRRARPRLPQPHWPLSRRSPSHARRWMFLLPARLVGEARTRTPRRPQCLRSDRPPAKVQTNRSPAWKGRAVVPGARSPRCPFFRLGRGACLGVHCGGRCWPRRLFGTHDKLCLIVLLGCACRRRSRLWCAHRNVEVGMLVHSLAGDQDGGGSRSILRDQLQRRHKHESRNGWTDRFRRRARSDQWQSKSPDSLVWTAARHERGRSCLQHWASFSGQCFNSEYQSRCFGVAGCPPAVRRCRILGKQYR